MYEGAASFVEIVLLPYGVYGLFVLSFFNSSVSPIPTEVLLIPLAFLYPENALLYGAVSTVASVLGAWFAYYLGVYGRFIRRFVSDEYFRIAGDYLRKHGVIIVGISGISPLPFKLFCITAGVFRLDLRRVLLVSFIFRGLRFFSVSIVVALYGRTMVRFFEENMFLAAALLGLVVASGYAVWVYTKRKMGSRWSTAED